MRIASIMIAAAALTFSPAHADTLWLHAASKHWDGGDYNEWNPGVGYQIDLTENLAVEPGAYWNSHRRPSTYLMVTYRFLRAGNLRVRAGIGFVDRYDGRKLEDGRALPLAGLIVQYGWARSINLPGVTGFGAAPWR